MKLNTIQSVSSSAYTTNQFRHSTKSATSCRETVSIHSFYGLGSLTATFSYHRDEILFTPICQFVYNLKCVVEEIFSDKVGRGQYYVAVLLIFLMKRFFTTRTCNYFSFIAPLCPNVPSLTHIHLNFTAYLLRIHCAAKAMLGNRWGSK